MFLRLSKKLIYPVFKNEYQKRFITMREARALASSVNIINENLPDVRSNINKQIKMRAYKGYHYTFVEISTSLTFVEQKHMIEDLKIVLKKDKFILEEITRKNSNKTILKITWRNQDKIITYITLGMISLTFLSLVAINGKYFF